MSECSLLQLNDGNGTKSSRSYSENSILIVNNIDDYFLATIRQNE